MTAATELQTWLNGTATGGPNGDGRYPLTDPDGVIHLVYCPAAQALNPTLAEQPIEVFANTASNAAATATAESAEAEQAAIDAQTHAANALTYKTQAQQHASSSFSAYQSATVVRDEIQVLKIDIDNAYVDSVNAADNASFSAGEAANSASAAAISESNAAASAASVNPTNYYDKAAADARFRLQSATVAWGSLSGIPLTFAPSAHTHAIADVTGLSSALAGKAASSHTHTTQDVSGLDTALAARVALTGDQDVGGVKTFTAGSIRIKGYSGAAGDGVVYFGDIATDDYIYKVGSLFRFKSGANLVDINTDVAGTVWHSGTFNPATKATLGATVSFYNVTANDITASRGDGSGVIFLNNTNTRYLYYDGGNYVMPAANLWVNGSPVWTSATFDPNTKAPVASPTFTTQFTLTAMSTGAGIWYDGTSVAQRAFLGMEAGSNTAFRLYSYALAANVIATDLTNGRTSFKEMTVDGSSSYFFKPATNDMGLMGSFRCRGESYLLYANAAGWLRQPRIFVGGADPGAAAADGDIWIP